MMARLKWYLYPPTPHQLKKIKVGPHLKFVFWIRACTQYSQDGKRL